MDTSPVDDGPPADAPGTDSDVVTNWIVRIFLVLSFGLAFGIEGMTLVRSFIIDGGNEAEERVEEGNGREEESGLRALSQGDDLLPDTDISERVGQLRIRAQTDAPWAFRLVVVVENQRDAPYRLTVRRLQTDDGTVREEAQSVHCPPRDSTRLVASWPIGADARPESVTVIGEVWPGTDSTQTVEERVGFGHVPVQMIR